MTQKTPAGPSQKSFFLTTRQSGRKHVKQFSLKSPLRAVFMRKSDGLVVQAGRTAVFTTIAMIRLISCFGFTKDAMALGI